MLETDDWMDVLSLSGVAVDLADWARAWQYCGCIALKNEADSRPHAVLAATLCSRQHEVAELLRLALVLRCSSQKQHADRLMDVLVLVYAQL